MHKLTNCKPRDSTSHSKGMALLVSLGVGAAAFSNLLYFGVSFIIPSTV